MLRDCSTTKLRAHWCYPDRIALLMERGKNIKYINIYAKLEGIVIRSALREIEGQSHFIHSRIRIVCIIDRLVRRWSTRFACRDVGRSLPKSGPTPPALQLNSSQEESLVLPTTQAPQLFQAHIRISTLCQSCTACVLIIPILAHEDLSTQYWYGEELALIHWPRLLELSTFWERPEVKFYLWSVSASRVGYSYSNMQKS